VQVARREAPFPGGAREDLLDHEGVHVDHAVLQQVQAEHAQLLGLCCRDQRAAAARPSRLAVTGAGRTLDARVPASGSVRRPQ